MKTSKAKNQFGAFGGVFTPCVLTILGVIMFMRANFVVGEAGILAALLILILAKTITLFTAFSTSAIGTNMQVRGGGAYFLISRVLGPEFGGAIGMMLFLAQALSVPFYILGFTEALLWSYPGLEPFSLYITLSTALLLFVVTWFGAGWAIKIQYGIMAILFVSIILFLGGAFLRFDPSILSANLHAGYSPINPAAPDGDRYSFWIIFAIYFPAVTGIMAGINMSGDLDNPTKAIPKGTLSAIAFTFVVYLIQLVLCGGAYDRADLIERPFLLLQENALFRLGFLVTAGMFAASLSSALGSYMGAPRVLQAVARDRILPILKPFARGSAQGDEPRHALLLTAGITFLVLLWAAQSSGGQALNSVAVLITEFFLYTYGMLNFAAFLEAVTDNPSFRPTFRFFHWSTGLLGGLGCLGVAFLINAVQALLAMGIMAALVWYMKRRQLRATYGDVRRGMVYRSLRDNLIRYTLAPDSGAKNWRPTCIVFAGNPDARPTLATYALWIEAGHGLVFLADILNGSFEEYAPRRAAAEERLIDFCRKRDLFAFPVVSIDEDISHGITAMLQTVGIGPIRPNMALFGWSQELDRVPTAVSLLRQAQSLGMANVIVHPGAAPLQQPEKTRIDVWWRGMKNGGLMLLLAHLIQSNWEWEKAEIRLMRLIENEAGEAGTVADLKQLLREARVKATIKVIAESTTFPEVLARESSDADCLILGFEIPEAEKAMAWYEYSRQMLCPHPTTLFVCATGEEDAMA